MNVYYDHGVDALYIQLGTEDPEGVSEMSDGVNKEQCRQETEHFSPEEYLTWIRKITEELIRKYHLTLQVVQR